jgi:hypothetical protein
MTKSDTMFYAGLAMATGGALIASPLDEMATIAATGGTGVVIAPIQAVATGAIGGLGILAGVAMMALSGTLEKSK